MELYLEKFLGSFASNKGKRKSRSTTKGISDCKWLGDCCRVTQEQWKKEEVPTIIIPRDMN